MTQPDILDEVDVNNDGVIDSRDFDALNLIINGPTGQPTGWTLE